jgi:hypothetical protein
MRKTGKLFSKIMVCLLLAACVISGPAYNASAVEYLPVVTSYNQVRDRYTNTIYPNVKINADRDYDLSEITIFYWFTVDQVYYESEQFFCDYAQISGPYQNKNITSKVNGSFEDVTSPDPSGAPETETVHAAATTFTPGRYILVTYMGRELN